MKKKMIIAAGIVILLVLIVPIPKTYNDGTRDFRALTYRAVKWNRCYGGDLCYNLTRFYSGREMLKSIDELWAEIEPDDAYDTDNILLDEDIAADETDTSENMDGRIFVEHGNINVYVNEADSKYIKSVILKYQENDDAVFCGSRDYVIHCKSNPFGSSDIVYYDISEGQLGNSSINYIRKEEKLKFDDILYSYFDNNNGSQNTKTKSTSTTIKTTPGEKGLVRVCRFEMNNMSTLSDTKADRVRAIIGSYAMNKPSWDNISDYTISVDGVYYAYDSSSGILTKDDTHADKLSDGDRRALNKAIGISDSASGEPVSDPLTSHPTIVTDTFVITKISGTYLELRKVVYGTDTEKLVYCCDLGSLDGSADMNYKVGDDITLRYDYDIAETYPLQLTVKEIL